MIMMAVYLKILPGVKVRITKRGLRWGYRAACGTAACRRWRYGDLDGGRAGLGIQGTAAP